MRTTAAILIGFLLDAALGDPVIPHFPHPVVIMGRIISKSETRLRKLFPNTSRGRRTAGAVLAFCLPACVFGVTFALLYLASRVHPILALTLESLWCWQALAMRDLVKESRNVYRELNTGDLPSARRAVARIVGRDTDKLTAEGVIRAAVETVSENFSDGVVAPLMYMLIGGAPLAMAYKAVNTMDSMVGYKNEKYIDFGRNAAKIDDCANFVPSRIAALIWIVCTGRRAGEAYRIWRRDRRNHSSPNSAQCESACAGGLGIQLGGPASYFGQVYKKPTIGDDTRPPISEDILRADATMVRSSTAALLIGIIIRFSIILLLLR